jgi:anti-sigma factor RsiW
MAEHNQMTELISRYIDGELTQHETLELEEHLKQCPSCRSVLSAYKAIAEASAQSRRNPGIARRQRHGCGQEAAGYRKKKCD